MNGLCRDRGFSWLELLVVGTVLALLSSMALGNSARERALQQLHHAVHQLQVAIDRGRLAAQRKHQPCAVTLHTSTPSTGIGSLPPCDGVGDLLTQHQRENQSVHWSTNLPPQLRFTTNGLVIDGGLVVFSHPATLQQPCVVVSLPLGVMRQGLYEADPMQELSSSRCLPGS